MTTIIIPAYNQAEYLSDAIQSALDQTVKCEVIVINDGSTDGTLEVARSFPVKVVDQVNKGLPSARNTGIMHATGDYILPLDADDVLQDNSVERLLEVAHATDADIIAPSFKCFGVQNGDVILKPNPTLEDFKVGNHIGYFSLVKKSVLLEVGGYNPRMVYGWEDLDLWVDLLKRGKKLVTIPDKLVLYRTKGESMYTESLKHADFLANQLRINHPTVYA